MESESESAQSETEPAPAESLETIGEDDEIVLTEGKTLSDYLEDVPEAPKASDPKEFRSIPNVERMIVPPPRICGGILGATFCCPCFPLWGPPRRWPVLTFPSRRKAPALPANHYVISWPP